MSDFGPQVHRTEVDGVPAYWADVPGKFTATLMFRVGTADEQLAGRGLTHLIEHLVMPAHARRLFDCNASVEETRTLFWAAGTEDEVATFLAETTARLSALPLERLEAERGILRTEEEGRRPSPYFVLLVEYFGARGFGVDAYPQYGVASATGEALTAWAARYFTSGNATLWLTGAPPAGLRLELPDGERRRAPAPEPVPARPAACYWGAGGGLTVAALVRRTFASNTTGWIFSDRVHHRLRYELGLSYSSASNYDRWTADDAFVTVWPDVQEGREQEGLEAMLGVLDDLADSGATADELEHVAASVRRTVADAAQANAYLDSDAFDELLGAEVITREDVVARQEALTIEEVAAGARALREAAVWVVPEAVKMPEGGPAPVPTESAERVDGRRYARRASRFWKRSPESIVLSDDAIALDLGDGRAIAVRFADCQALLVSEDGYRELIGQDGFRIWLATSEWKRGDEIVARVDEAVAADRRITSPS